MSGDSCGRTRARRSFSHVQCCEKSISQVIFGLPQVFWGVHRSWKRRWSCAASAPPAPPRRLRRLRRLCGASGAVPAPSAPIFFSFFLLFFFLFPRCQHEKSAFFWGGRRGPSRGLGAFVGEYGRDQGSKCVALGTANVAASWSLGLAHMHRRAQCLPPWIHASA